MSSILLALEVPWEGKTYLMKRPNEHVEGKFTGLLKTQAVRGLEAWSNSTLYELAATAITRDINAYFYDWGEEGWRRAVMTQKGQQDVIGLILMEFNQDQKFDQATFRKMWADDKTRALMIKHWFALNAPTPTTTPEQEASGAKE